MTSNSTISSLLQLTDVFLTGNGFDKTAKQLKKEAERKGLTLTEGTPKTTLPTLDSVYSFWQSKHQSDKSENSGSEDDSDDDTSSASSIATSSAESDSDSSDDSSEDDDTSADEETKEAEDVSVASKLVAKLADSKHGKKRKRDVITIEDNSSSEDISESDSDLDKPEANSTEVAKAVVSVNMIPEKSEVDSESDSSSERSSDSSSDSDSESESDADSGVQAVKTEITKVITSIPQAEAIKQDDSSPSSATLDGTPLSSALGSSMNADRKRRLEDASAGAGEGGDNNSAKRFKKNNVPFSRISKDQAIDPKLASNKFVPYDYAQRAHEKLIVTKGKNFTKEKNKGKRGSYRGGKIDFTPKGIKFAD